MTRNRRLAATIVSIMLVAAACSGEDTAAPTVAPSPPTMPAEIEPSTTDLPATIVTPTTVPPSEPPPTDPPTTTAMPTTEPPDPAVEAEATLRRAAIRARKAYLYAVKNYDAPDALDRLATGIVRGGPSWDVTLGNMRQLRRNGWRIRPNPEARETVAVEAIELGGGPPYRRAAVTVCEVGTSIVYEPGGSPDGSDTIVNDLIVARRAREDYVMQEGEWKKRTGAQLGEWTGETSCPAA